MEKKIALLAFEGGLPKAILESVSKNNQNIMVILDEFPAEVSSENLFHLENWLLFSYLKKNKVTHICLAGRTTDRIYGNCVLISPVLKRYFLLYALKQGDDGLLRLSFLVLR